MPDWIIARGFGRLLSERWFGRWAASRMVAFQYANPGDCRRVNLVLEIGDQPEARENRLGGRSSGWGRGARGFWPKVRKEPVLAPAGCWIWTGALDKDGAGKFCTKYADKPKHVRAARHAWTLLRGDPGAGALIALCGERACVNPDHRKHIEHTALVRTLHELGREFEYADNRGEMCGRAILTEEAVRFIRLQASVRGSMPLLARLCGCSVVTINAVKYGRTWRHVRGRANKTELLSLAQLRALVEQRAGEQFRIEDFAEARSGDAA